MVNKDNENGLIGKKRNLDDKSINGEPNNKKKKLENNNKNQKSKKGESPMLEINKNQLKSVQKLKKNDRKNNRDKKHRNKKDYNRMNNRKIQEETEAKFSWEKVSEKEEEEKFMNFEKDLKDYLRRTISANRQNEFFSNVIPESLDIVKNLFQKNSNLQVNKLYPIYRNDKGKLVYAETIEEYARILGPTWYGVSFCNNNTLVNNLGLYFDISKSKLNKRNECNKTILFIK